MNVFGRNIMIITSPLNTFLHSPEGNKVSESVRNVVISFHPVKVMLQCQRITKCELVFCYPSTRSINLNIEINMLKSLMIQLFELKIYNSNNLFLSACHFPPFKFSFECPMKYAKRRLKYLVLVNWLFISCGFASA